MSLSKRTIRCSITRRTQFVVLSLLMTAPACMHEDGKPTDILETEIRSPENHDAQIPDSETVSSESIVETEREPDEWILLQEDLAADGEAETPRTETLISSPDEGGEQVETSLGEPCDASFVTCRNGVRYSCGVSGVLVADPCPAGMVCLDGGCVDNVTRIYIVVDGDSLPYKFLVDQTIMELALTEAQQAGSICPAQAVSPFPPPLDSYVATGFLQMRTQLLAAFLLRRLLDSFLKDPHVQIVIIHSPHRTAVQQTATEETLCSVGHHEAVSLPANGFTGPCAFSPFSDSDLEQAFPFVVYGYPNPWILDAAKILEYADGVETVRDTGLSCTSSDECGTGGCFLGSCFEHENDELRSSRLPDPIEFSSPGGGLGFCNANLLYLAAEFIRRHGTSAGRSCMTDEDCYPRPAHCGSDGRCVDDAASCVRNHVLYLAAPCYNGDSLVQVVKWMRNHLYCEDHSCAGDACLAPPTDDPQFPCYFGSSNPPEMCVPSVPGFTGSSEDPPVPTIVAEVVRGWNSPPISQGPFEYLDGRRLEVTTHMVFAGGYSPYDHYYAGYPLIVSLGNAIAGGGRWVIPGNGETPLSPDLYGPFAGHWSDQLEELLEFIAADRATFVCSP